MSTYFKLVSDNTLMFMIITSFETLLNVIGPKISKCDISKNEKLVNYNCIHTTFFNQTFFVIYHH